MSKKRKLVILTFLSLFLLGHFITRLKGKEFWPFSNYPMYSKIFKPEKIFYREVWGISANNSEFRLNSSEFFSPYNDRSLEEIFLNQSDLIRRREILKALFEWYNTRAQDETKITAIELRRVTYDFLLLKKLIKGPIDIKNYREHPESSVTLVRYSDAQ